MKRNTSRNERKKKKKEGRHVNARPTLGNKKKKVVPVRLEHSIMYLLSDKRKKENK